MEKKMSDSLLLSLGQIIKIIAPNNDAINNKIFLINYIDKSIVELVEQKSLKTRVLNIKEGFLTEESIETIQVLYKPDKQGFARQNDLTVNRNITIEFGGEVPTIINGKITNLEEDRIEITSYPDKQYFYIDFEYKGIPRDLPIRSIKDFVLPKKSEDVDEKKDVELDVIGETIEEANDEPVKLEGKLDDMEQKLEGEKAPIDVVSDDEEDADIMEPDDVVNLDEDLIDIGEIEFIDEELEQISEEVEVSESDKIYDITDQMSDLMDDLLASVPSSQQTPKFLNYIHVMLERYSELREEFSKFDDFGYFSDVTYKTNNYKPVKRTLQDMKIPVYWALPVIKTKKHLFDVDAEGDDYKNIETYELLDDIKKLQTDYKLNSIPDEQNKYDFLHKNLPFEIYEKPDDTSDVLVNTYTTNNNVIIDNRGDFKSINADVVVIKKGIVSQSINVPAQHRFVVDKMSEGLSKIKPTSHKSPGCPKTVQANTKHVKITNDDKMYVKGLITLPYDAMEYSKIYDINNSLLKRVNYHENPINYSEILNDNTEVILNDLKSPVDIFNNVVYHYKDADDYNSENKSDTWKEIIDNAVPNVETIFKTLKSEMEKGVSMDRIIEYLSPYNINIDDIVYKDYETFKTFIESEIKSYKKGTIDSVLKYNNYLKFIKKYKKISFLDKYASSEEMKKLYDFNEDTDVQFLNKMYQLDDGKLMMGLIAKEIHNENAKEDTQLNPEVLMQLKTELSNKANKNEGCEPVIKDSMSLSKKYYELDDLLQDNDKNVIYDDKYDNTPYDIYEELSDGKDIKYADLVEHLIKNVGVEKKAAETDAKSMIDGYKSVQDGDYAILEPNGYEMHYYVRRGNKWDLDENMSNKPIEEMGFCNLKDHCLKINNECVNKESQETVVNELSVDELIKHYEDKQEEERSKRTLKIVEGVEKDKSVASMLKNVNKKRALKYDIQKINIGKMLSAEEIVVSPYEKLKTRILGELDVSSKMAHILTFVNNYCRSALVNESSFWYYCTESNVPLLPTFYNDLAIAFENGTYIAALNEIVRERGTSEGDNIVDKHSGYIIKKLQYDENEGYEATGFKKVTREVMEEETDIMLTTSASTGSDVNKKHMMFGKEIKKILKTLDTKLKINTKQQHEFIVKYMITFIKKYTLSEKKYVKKMKEAKKKAKAYKKYKDEIKIFLLLGMYVIAIQLVTPHIGYAPTYEGCVMSFDGFPLEEGDDRSIISYISCLFLKLKSSIRPWNVLPSTRRSNFNEIKDKFVEKVIVFMKSKILTNEDILNKLEEKRDWMILNKTLDEGRQVFDIKNWDTFLPHLNKVNVNDTRSVSGNFNRLLDESIAKGNISQFSYIFSLMGKIINQSFLIQEDMERVVTNTDMILNTINNVPFLENACCNETKNSFKYFTDKEPLILQRNNEIKQMMEKLNKYMKIKKAPYIYNDENTRIKPLAVDTAYSEETIYLSFIKYCKYNTGAILDDELQRLCVTNESSFNKYDSLGDKIKKMKQEESNYSSDSLLELMKIISKRNIIRQGFSESLISPKILFENKLVENGEEGSHELSYILDTEIINGLKNLLKSFDLKYSEGIENEISDLIIVINEKNKALLDVLISKIKKTRGKKKTLATFINSIDVFKDRKGMVHVSDDDETKLYAIEFLKKALFNSCIQYPQLILGGVRYDDIGSKMPKHWKFSEYHYNKLETIVKRELENFTKFSGDEDIDFMMEEVIKRNKKIQEFSKYIPIYADIVGQTKIDKSTLNLDIPQSLYKYLILKSLVNYVNVEETIKANKSFENPDIEENVFEESNETLMDKMSEILTVILETFNHQKSTIDYSMEEIHNNVLNVKEMEKNDVVERLKNMNKEDRKSEDYMKNLRLGDWNLGQTNALYIYNPGQYDKEIQEENKKKNMRTKIQNSGEDLDAFQEDVMMENMVQDEITQNYVNQEMMNDMMAMGEDDDHGDMDGDEMY